MNVALCAARKGCATQLRSIHMNAGIVSLLLWTYFSTTTCKVIDGLSVPRPSFKADQDETQYVVLVEKKDASGDSDFDHAIAMKDSFGKEYKCLMPESGDDEQDGTTDADVLAERAFQERTPSKILDTFGSLCFYRIEEWWTYEVCYKKHVRQFHKDALTEKLASEYNLGVFSEQHSVTDNIKEDSTVDSNYKKYVSQYYLDGQVCDLTKQPRTTEVRFVCQTDFKDGIVSIKEAPSCQYTIYIATPKLCSHPEFKQKEAQASFIRCRAVRSEGPISEDQHLEEWAQELEDVEDYGPAADGTGGDCGDEESQTCSGAQDGA